MKCSIITVNYNNKNGLLKTIKSVISQTYHDFEFIIIDGGSTDGSLDILKEYNNYITYWVSEPDGGIYQGMNKGIQKANGDYLNFMNSGDCYYNEDVLEKVFNYGYDSDIITGRDYHYNHEKQMGHASIQPTRMSMITFFTSTIDHQSSFIKHELFNGSPYREDLRLVSDWVFFLEKVVIEGKQVQFIPDIVCFREDGGITAQQYDKNLLERDLYLHKLLPYGIYSDYKTLAKLDKRLLFSLFNIIDIPQKKKFLILFLKLLSKI